MVAALEMTRQQSYFRQALQDQVAAAPADRRVDTAFDLHIHVQTGRDAMGDPMGARPKEATESPHPRATLSPRWTWTLVTPRVWTLATRLDVIPWTLATHTNN